jgi:receptor protein-tyrosine kinase
VSRIFDMLYKAEGEVADFVRPVVDAQTGRRPAEPGGPATEADAAPPPVPPSRQEAVPPPAPHARETRTVPLHIAAPSPLLPFEDGHWRPGEQYRILRTKIVQHPRQPRFIVVSSPAPGDGKSVSAINTAGALALKNEGQVLLLDADLRKSAVHAQLGLPQSPGLVEVLTGTATLDEALMRTRELPNLWVLPAGARAANPVELLDSARWRSLSAELREAFRYVIVDSPPVAAVADYELIQSVCDGVILVFRPDHTNRHLCRKALDFVQKGKFLGVVLNCVPEWAPAAHLGADYYYYSDKNA